MAERRTAEYQELSVKDINAIVTEEFSRAGLSPDTPYNRPMIYPKGPLSREEYDVAMARVLERCFIGPPERACGTLRDVIGYVKQQVNEDVRHYREAGIGPEDDLSALKPACPQDSHLPQSIQTFANNVFRENPPRR